GQVDLMFDQLSSSLPLINSGKLKALGVTTLERSSVSPDLPTLHESGLTNFEASTTAGILFPADTPDEVVEKFSEALQKVMSRPSTVQAFRNMGADVVPGTAQDFDQIMLDETTKWTTVVNDADIK